MNGPLIHAILLLALPVQLLSQALGLRVLRVRVLRVILSESTVI